MHTRTLAAAQALGHRRSHQRIGSTPLLRIGSIFPGGRTLFVQPISEAAIMLAALHSVLLATLGLSPSPLVATRRAALASAAAAVLCRDRASAATYGGGRASRCDSIFAGTFTDGVAA